MSCEEASSKQGGGDVMDPVPSGTKLTYQAVEPMSRVHDNATANVAANVYTGAGEQVKTTTRGGGNSSKCCCCCVGLSFLLIAKLPPLPSALARAPLCPKRTYATSPSFFDKLDLKYRPQLLHNSFQAGDEEDS
ncbi:hypothetical protein ACET3Z_008000 [Daucus carota]